MTTMIARRERALDLLARWREHSEHNRRWEALLELLELRELLHEDPDAGLSLPPGFDLEQHF